MVRRSHRHRRPQLVFGLGLALTLAFGTVLGLSPSSPRVAGASPPANTTAQGSLAEQDEPLAARIDALLDGTEFLAGARVGVHIVDLADGSEVYARNADLALNPASNAKLVTTAAALARLGPDHVFATKVYAEGGSFSPESGEVSGKLYLRGSGDPSLRSGDIYALAAMVQAAGVTKIKGPIVVDASRFDHDGLPPGFDQKDEFASHRAPSGAMSVNYNTYEVFARPASALGDPPVLRVEPPVPGFVLDPSRASTVAGNQNKLWVSTRELDGQTVVRFHGELGISNGPSAYRYPVSDPSRYAGELFALALRQRGVKLSKARIRRGEVPSDARRLAVHESAPLSVLCRSVNKWSNNFMAEQLLRALAPGKGASAEQALTELRAYADEIAMPGAGLVLGNGSGLYANNMIAPIALTHLLARVHADFRFGSDYLASLAVMGRDGTTTSRLTDSPARGWVRVKTGTLADVSALSGYAGAQGRAPFAFSILLNGLERKHLAKARALQDAIAELLAHEAAKSAQFANPP